MKTLTHLIYCSAAQHPFSHGELETLLLGAHHYNARHGITGMLLYAEGSFFQILEGAPADVERLFARIRHDIRHGHVTVIINEPIAARAFSCWSMGHAELTPDELDAIVGTNDFFTSGHSFLDIGEGRAKKLLAAFRIGRWRTNLGKADVTPEIEPEPALQARPPPRYAFAFQPIIHAPTRSIYSYEALIRGPAGEPAASVLEQVPPSAAHVFREQQRIAALKSAARLGLSTRININFQPTDLRQSPTAVSSLLAVARGCGIPVSSIILEILESEIIGDSGDFSERINPYRTSGLTFAIDDFGSGYAGLNLLAGFQPDLIKIDINLVRGIESNGPRQAIVRGILRTCTDLGIDIVAEGVEAVEEYAWFRSEGIELFQGFLFAKPAFDCLPTEFHVPE